MPLAAREEVLNRIIIQILIQELWLNKNTKIRVLFSPVLPITIRIICKHDHSSPLFAANAMPETSAESKFLQSQLIGNYRSCNVEVADKPVSLALRAV